MKKILFKKILSDCLIFFTIALFFAALVIWIFQAVNHLDIMIEDGRDHLTYVKFTLLIFPKIITKLLPFIFFLSFIYIITKYEIDNELIIFWNFGVSKISVINFFFKFSLVIVIFQIILTSYVVPKSQDKARSYLRNSNVNIIENLIKPRKFNDTIKDLLIKKKKNLNIKKKKVLKQKLFSYLSQKGYEQNLILKHVNNSIS